MNTIWTPRIKELILSGDNNNILLACTLLDKPEDILLIVDYHIAVWQEDYQELLYMYDYTEAWDNEDLYLEGPCKDYLRSIGFNVDDWYCDNNSLKYYRKLIKKHEQYLESQNTRINT